MTGKPKGRARVRTAGLSVGDRILIQQLDHGSWHPGRLLRAAVPGEVVSLSRTDGRAGRRSSARYRVGVLLDSGRLVGMDAAADELQFLADTVGPEKGEK
jgi:hypothetical protein